MSIEEWREKKIIDSSMQEINDTIEKFRKPYRRPAMRGRFYRAERDDLTPEQAEVVLDILNVLIVVIAGIFAIIPIIYPNYQVCFLFALALAFTLVTKSLLAKVATVIFTIIYFVMTYLTGCYFGMEDVFGLMLQVNTVSLVPAIVGTLFAIIAMGTGITHGIAKSTAYAGIWLVALAFIISLADTVVAYFFLELEDWWLVFTTHLAIYTVALLISWAIFYIPARGIRAGIDAATG
ncbi:MAG: hypothetical protein ACTSRC_18755 [Candidatus Helarchaeota archaeon]